MWFFFIFPSFYILYTYFLVHIISSFIFSQLCDVLSTIGWKLLVVHAYVSHHMQLDVHFEICLHDTNYHI